MLSILFDELHTIFQLFKHVKGIYNPMENTVKKIKTLDKIIDAIVYIDTT